MQSVSLREALALLTGGALLLGACVGPPPASVLPLEPGVLDEVLLSRGGERTYLLPLAAGQYAELLVDQQGIDVEVSLEAPDGRTVATVDSNNGILGPEPLPVIAPVSGRFRLHVRDVSRGVPAGRYVLRLAAPVRPATARDHARVEAESILAASEQLRFRGLRGDRASFREAVPREKEALARFRALGLREREAETLFCLGRSHHGLADGEASAGFYRQALALYRALHDGPQVAVTLTNLGYWERVNGRSKQALVLYREALPLNRRFHNRDGEALTLLNIGRAAMDLGETGEAHAAFKESLALYRVLGNQLMEGMALSNLGYLELDLGQPQQALVDLDRALELLTAAGDRGEQGVAWARIAVARALAHRPRKEVLGAFHEALNLQREMGDRHEAAVTRHNLGWYHYSMGELGQARRLIRETLALFQVLGDRATQARALLNLGEIDLELGRPAAAESSFLRARALLKDLGDTDQEALALLGLARTWQRQGDATAALEAVEGSISRIEALRRKPSSLDLRMTFFASKQDASEFRVGLLMNLHRRDPRAGYAARALAASEQARARTLLDLLAAVNVQEEGSGDVLTSHEIQRQVVEPGTLLLEYFLGRERSYLWAVTPGAVESFDLPARAVLEEKARRAATFLEAGGSSLAGPYTEPALADLSNLLLAPVASLLDGAQRLVIVPDGALWSISFAALPDPAGGSRLVTGHEIVILPSASVLPRLREAAAGRRPAPGTIAMVADPVFDAADPRVTASPARPIEALGQRVSPPESLERLPGSRAEAQAILAVAPPGERLVALDFSASRATVLSGRLAPYRIVHFATHAVLDTEHPELSGIMLSRVDPRGRPRDGRLRLAEIYRLRLPADLVVLSGCRTALGREIRGEGLIGLTRGFFSAGARQVLVSLWPVDDRATAELMKRFYTEMFICGRPPAAALRAAQTAMSSAARWRPHDWAGFILQGDWLVFPNEPRSHVTDLSSCDGRKP